MRNLVIYDSLYGNTERVAQAIAQATHAKLEPLAHLKRSMLEAADLIFVGSPTQGGRPTPPLKEFLDQLPEHSLRHRWVAAFDTRYTATEHNFFLRLIMKLAGFAAPRIADQLIDKGGQLAAEPEGFIVHDSKGPLKTGELQRATDWAKGCLATATKLMDRLAERENPANVRPDS